MHNLTFFPLSQFFVFKIFKLHSTTEQMPALVGSLMVLRPNPNDGMPNVGMPNEGMPNSALMQEYQMPECRMPKK
jgi:hypothetical protein